MLTPRSTQIRFNCVRNHFVSPIYFTGFIGILQRPVFTGWNGPVMAPHLQRTAPTFGPVSWTVIAWAVADNAEDHPRDAVEGLDVTP